MTVEIAGVHHAYGAHQVLRDVDLHVPTGSLGVLLGPSGCGKTTLLRIVAGHLQPDAGTLRVDGRLLAGPGVFVAPQRRGIAIVPQDGALFPHLDVADNVAFGLPGRLRRRARHSARVRELLDLVGLPGAEGLLPGRLSGGQQQRVALARALAPEPALVLLDEPFSALDASLRGTIRRDVRHALRAAGATALMVTHDQEEALSMADSVAVLEAGRIVMHDAPASVYGRPASLGVARFVGDAVELDVTPDGETVLGALPRDVLVPERGGVAVIRPEHLAMSPCPMGATDCELGRVAVVDEVQYFGHDTLVALRLPGAAAPIHARCTIPPAVGTTVRVRIEGPVSCFATGPSPAAQVSAAS